MRWVLLLTALAAFAGSGSASTDVTLLVPRDGDRLEGGRESTLVWPAASFPSDAREWEAFLSLDDGAHFPVRITPHLDSRVRSIRWRVPNVATAHARIMVRAGDERNERFITLHETFTIVPSATTIDLASLALEKGESATPGSEPAVEWVTSDFVTHRCAASLGSQGPQLTSEPVSIVNATTPSVTRLTPSVVQTRTFSRAARPRTPHASLVRPLLLLTTRLNI